MKVTNGDIFGAKDAMAKVLNLDLPARTSLQLVKLGSALNKMLEDIEVVRVKLVQKYGVQDPKTGDFKVAPTISMPAPDTGEPQVIPNPEWPGFSKEYQDLMDQEEEIAMEKVQIPEEVNGKPVIISAMTIGALEMFVEIK
jgi:hypothetical protein